ncbi:LysR family transcriptional regulator [Labrenzia sp. PHM005]|uniref:LysR family transcriptional regulator n=1 Tax=Labrenzia sp. PHM005 TaxID=2590016 RepID=UPI0011405550|nr:LysR family transcriptional regulator [Labrenzia sp. PHM005]QDG76301.1 LysR family transcriptional regulator [Labrenzia sp. PHM005]
MDYNLFPVFVEIMRHRNISKAAAVLGLTQPAASNALARLRHQFGDQLFIRASRGVVPTKFATDIGPEIEQHVERLKELTQTQSKRAVDLKQVVRNFKIVAHDMEECLILPLVISGFSEEAPNVRIEIRPFNRVTLADELVAGRVDIVMAYLRDPYKNLISRELYFQDFVCVCRGGHSAVGQRLTLQEYVKLQHMIVSPEKGGFSGLVDDKLAEKGLTRNVQVSTPHFLSACQYVAGTDFLLTLPRQVALMGAKAFGLQVFELPFELDGFSTSIHWHRRLDKDPEHIALRDLLQEIVKTSL